MPTSAWKKIEWPQTTGRRSRVTPRTGVRRTEPLEAPCELSRPRRTPARSAAPGEGRSEGQPTLPRRLDFRRLTFQKWRSPCLRVRFRATDEPGESAIRDRLDIGPAQLRGVGIAPADG